MAGRWVFSPRGLGGLDPTVIPYAPPGFPFLVGLAYGLLRRRRHLGDPGLDRGRDPDDPAVGMAGLPDLRAGAGAAAAAFAAMSGPHIAFSRMALTDASFLLFWLIAIGLGQRFLERPGPGRAAALGLAVGVAQLFKYNGWIAGVLVALGAVAWTLIRARRTDRQEADRDLGMGPLRGAGRGRRLLALVPVRRVAWRIRRAHRPPPRLPGRPWSWPGYAMFQLEQDRALSGGVWWLAFGSFAAAVAMLTAIGARESRFPAAARMLVESLGLRRRSVRIPTAAVRRGLLDLHLRVSQDEVCDQGVLPAAGRVGCAGGADALLSSLRAALAARPGPRLAPAGRARSRPSASTSIGGSMRPREPSPACPNRWSASWRGAGSSRSCWPSSCRRGPMRGASRRCSSRATRSAAHAA